MPRVLLVEDDRSLAGVLAMAFEDGGHTVILAHDGREGLARALADSPDLVVCDVGLPRLDGFGLCRALRERGNRVPFLLLTARDAEIDHALGLDLGADDYVVKPASVRVLLSRIAALLRRTAGGIPDKTPLRVGPLAIDRERLAASWAGTPFDTTVTELRLLEALAERPGVVLSRSRLLERARGDDSDVTERLVDAYVRRIRKKIGAIDPAAEPIETVIGAGYRLRVV